MFTGIVEELGVLHSTQKTADGIRLRINASKVLQGTHVSSSICVNGVCLTAIEMGSDYFDCDVMAVTCDKSNLGSLQAGDALNLERALLVGGRLEGHFMLGHVDAKARVLSVLPEAERYLLCCELLPALRSWLLPQGTVALDGVSLTVADLAFDSFTVALIAHTRHASTLGHKKSGDWLNVEADYLAKLVVNSLTRLKTS